MKIFVGKQYSRTRQVRIVLTRLTTYMLRAPSLTKPRRSFPYTLDWIPYIFRSDVSNDVERLVRLLKVFDFFFRQLHIYTSDDVLQVVEVGSANYRCSDAVFGEDPRDADLSHADTAFLRNFLDPVESD